MQTESHKTLMKENKQVTKGKTCHVHELKYLVLLKCPYCPKLSVETAQSLSKFQWHFLTEIEYNSKIHRGSSLCVSALTNLNSIHEDSGSIPGLTKWVKGSGVAMSHGIGHR